MKIPTRNYRQALRFNITPLIDIVFLLIIFQRRLFGKQEQLSERKILVTNIFFGGVASVISLFLLLTLTGLFSDTHPISVTARIALFVLSLGIGYAFFEYLKRYPRFVPAPEPAEPGMISEPENKEELLKNSDEKPTNQE